MKQVTDVGSLSNKQLVNFAARIANERGIASKREFKLREPALDDELARRHLRNKVVLQEAQL
jgi:hypothetical protein